MSADRPAPDPTASDVSAIPLAAMNALGEGVLYFDATGTVRWMNDAARRLLGDDLRRFQDPELRRRLVRGDGTPLPPGEQSTFVVLRTGQAVRDLEFGMPGPDGELRWYLINAHPVSDAGGAVSGVVSSFVDITDRRRAEQARTELARDLELILEETTDFVYFKDPDGRLRFASQAFARHLGHARWRDLVGKRGADLFPADDARAHEEQDRLVLAERRALLGVAHPYVTADGRRGHLETSRWPVVDPAGRVAGVFAISRDITDRLRTEERLTQVMAAVESTSEAIGISDARGRHVYHNAALARMLGLGDAPLDDADLGAFARDTVTTREMLEATRAGHAWIGEVALTARTGRTFPVLARVSPITDAGGEHAGLISVLTDITERKRAEATIRRRDAILEAVSLAAERFLRAATWRDAIDEVLAKLGEACAVSRVVVFEATPRADDVLLHWRHEWSAPTVPRRDGATLQDLPLRQMGFERWIGELGGGRAIHTNVADLPAAERAGLAVLGILSVAAVPIFVGGAWWGFIGLDDCAAERAWAEAHIDALRAAARLFGTAIEHERADAARAELEAQLRQAQKMEAVGQLAGGVAHDFNNMLQTILGCAELALRGLRPGDPGRELLSDIQTAGQRSAALTGQLLAFARRQPVAPRVLDLNEAVDRALSMLRRLIGEDIALAWRPGAALSPVEIDPGQVDQILTNLCVNARDAIAGVGTITIETEHARVDATAPPDGAAGDYVRLVVRDTGRGMDPHTLAHAFEPFFTTKGVGEGTGLGLATVYGIAQQNGGFVTVASEPGRGTTFAVYLPRRHPAAAPPDAHAPAARPTRGHETVLLVEDEPAVLRLTAGELEDLGYRVLAAATPAEALRIAEVHPGAIDLLLSDVVMPEMNGRQLAERLLARRPRLRVLLMSGYTADILARRGVADEGLAFLEKPYTLDELARRVRAVLDAGDAGDAAPR